jgi:Cell Wall Hydrolase
LVKNFLTPVTRAEDAAKIAVHREKNSSGDIGERAVLKHSIEIDDPFELSIEEKIFHNAKRICVAFAITAVTISGLDLMNIRPLESAAAFAHAHRHTRLADWPAIVRSGVNEFSISTQAQASVVVAIPADRLVMESLPALSPPKVMAAKPDRSPVAKLAAVRHEDALKVAMAPPPATEQATLADLAQRAQDLVRKARAKATPEDVAAAKHVAPAALANAAPGEARLQLASLETGVLPAAVAPQPAVVHITLPAHIAVLPWPAPPPSPAQRLHLEGTKRAKAESCLAKAVYFEARDQPYRGQVAVAQVVMNRVFSGIYPRDVCGVIYQNASHYLGCQFTFACDGRRKAINEFGAWARARRIARETLDGKLYVVAVGTATHYHATYVHPRWVHEMRRMAREGIHLFYRPRAWGSGANEPIWSRAELAALKKQR